MQQSTQILVIGGGPAGSTAATLLAREGFDVTLVEREIFPRYHIGESLLPSCLEIFDLLGIREQVEEQRFIRKYGGYFAWGKDSWILDFAELHHPYGFQVIRSEFDQFLLEYARSQGVHVFEGTEVRSLTFDGERPRSATWVQGPGGTNTGEITFDYLVDASGRAGVMAMRYLKNRQYHEAFQNVALWGYWEGAQRMSFAPEGSIANGSVPDGWLWGIPLPDGTMSVGFVTHKTAFKQKRQQSDSLEHIYLNAINECPLIAELIRPGKLISNVRTEQDYSYIADSLMGPGYFLIGDAACFIDPLLSTGVHLATHASMLCAASIASAIRGDVSEEQARHFFERSYRLTYLRLMVIVSGLYSQYNGKETYFWQAQQLSSHDYANPEALHEAFLFIVSGLEDLKDTGEARGEVDIAALEAKLPPAEAERAIAMYNVYRKVFSRSSTTPETSTEGLYVTTEPHLGLAFASSDRRGHAEIS